LFQAVAVEIGVRRPLQFSSLSLSISPLRSRSDKSTSPIDVRRKNRDKKEKSKQAKAYLPERDSWAPDFIGEPPLAMRRDVGDDAARLEHFLPERAHEVGAGRAGEPWPCEAKELVEGHWE